MSTAAELVVDAFGLLNAIDIVEAAPSPAEITKGLRAFSQMVDSWATEGLAIADQTRTCDIDGTTAVIPSPTDPLTSVVDVLRLAPGMNVNGTGVVYGSRILSIDSKSQAITLDQATESQASSVSVTFKALPFEAKFERGVAALLALQIAPLIGMDNIPPMVVRMAQSGWTALQANFMRIPPVGFDPGLALTSMRQNNVLISQN